MTILVQYLSDFDATIIKLLNLGLSFLLHIIGALMAFVVLQILRKVLEAEKLITRFEDSLLLLAEFIQLVLYVLTFTACYPIIWRLLCSY